MNFLGPIQEILVEYTDNQSEIVRFSWIHTLKIHLLFQNGYVKTAVCSNRISNIVENFQQNSVRVVDDVRLILVKFRNGRNEWEYSTTKWEPLDITLKKIVVSIDDLLLVKTHWSLDDTSWTRKYKVIFRVTTVAKNSEKSEILI